MEPVTAVDFSHKAEKVSKDTIKEDEFAEIFELYYKRLYNYTYYRVNSHEMAEDLTSNMFEKIMTKINTYKNEKAKFEVWIFTIARNTINDYFRKQKKHKIISIDSILDIVSTLVSQTTFAQETVEKILKTLSLGHVTMIEYDGNEPEEAALPESLKGNVFDKNKTPLEKITKNLFVEGIYTKDGEKIAKIDPKKGTIVTEKQMKEDEEKEKKNTLYVTDSSTLNQYTCFNVKLPTYLPDGYTFKNAEFTKDESGNVKDSKYAELVFKNQKTGKEIYMQERFACDETKTVSNAEDIQKININGVEAILSNGRNIDWEADGTIYYLSGKNIGKDEAIKVAESIK